MKTSNYISISYLIFLFGGVFILFLAAKFHTEAIPNWITLEKPLENFSVVVAEPGAKFKIQFGDLPKMQVFYKSPDVGIFPSSYVRNDTLFMFPYKGVVQSKKLMGGSTIFYDNILVFGNRIRSIEGKEKSNISISALVTDTLNVRLNQARLFCFSSGTVKLQKKVYLINAENSNVYINDIILHKLEFQLKQTRLETWNTSTDNLTGTLINHSELRTNKFKKISLDVDSTSNCTLNRY